MPNSPAEKLSAEITFLEADLLQPTTSSIFHLPSSRFAILANLPYVPDSHTINKAAMYEPKLAIFGGSDGLELYRKMFRQIVTNPQKPALILTESLPFQHDKMVNIAGTSGYELIETNDFIQAFSLKERRLA